MKKLIVCLFLFTILVAGQAWAAVFNVTSPAQFQAALDVAANNGEDDVINLAEATVFAIYPTLTYHPTGPENYSLTIQGAGAESTILDGASWGGDPLQILSINTRDISPNDANVNITITGMTFARGSSDSNNGGGVAVLTNSGSITLTNNTFTENEAIGFFGGGAYASSHSGPVTLMDNTFSANTADNSGGGACASSDDGLITLTNNIFSANTSTNSKGGGAYFSSEDGLITLTDNTFSANKAYNEGGGAYAYSYSSPLILTNNTFSANTAGETFPPGGYSGGGAYAESYSGQVTLTNNTFSGNTASANGGGALAWSSSKVDIYNNILWGNTAGTNGNDLYINGVGSCSVNLYSNDYGAFYLAHGALSQDYNIHVDPLFVDADFHLAEDSPCINAGDNGAPSLPDFDFEGDDRIIGSAVDIGADEFFVPVDLIVSQLSVSLRAYSSTYPTGYSTIYSTFRVSYTIMNQGGTDAGPTRVNFYLSRDGRANRGGTYLGSAYIPGIGSGDTYTNTHTFNLRSNSPLSQYYIIAEADAGNAVEEIDETNNTRSARNGRY